MSQVRNTSKASPRKVVDDASPASSVLMRNVVSGGIAAVQALVLSLAVVVLPAVVAYLAAGATAEGSGGSAVSVGLSAWLLGHGMPLETPGATLTLIPLGISALALFACYVSTRRSAHTSVAAWASATATYSLVTFAIAVAARASTGWGILYVLVGAALVGGVGAGLGILARADAPGLRGLVRPWLDTLPVGVQPGLVGGIIAVMIVIALSSVLTLVWAISGRADATDIIAGLAPGAVGGVILAITQLALVPNAVLYSAAWIAGPGFQIGSTTTFAPGSETLGPLPAIPLLGGLPNGFAASSGAAWAPVIVIVCGALGGIALWRRLATSGQPSVWAMASGVVTSAVVAGLAIGVLIFLGSGAIGPGSMAHVGANGLVVAGWIAGEVLIGAGLTIAAFALRAHRAGVES